jgi:DNA-binding MarR family transcriptional regulator
MPNDLPGRFRAAYWRAFRDADTLRLRQWEHSRVTLPQLRVMYHVRRRPGVTTGHLARALGITVSTTSGLVIKLVDRGLVDRGSAADDRRQAPLRLSTEGEALLGELSEATRVHLARLLDRLGEDADGVVAALERLAEAADALRAEDEADTVAPLTGSPR